jgi:hypothetical protein
VWPMAMGRELGEHVVGEDLRDQAHALDVGQMLAVGGGDAGRLLAAMLQGVEAEIGLAGGVGMAVNGDYAALFAELGSPGGQGKQGIPGTPGDSGAPRDCCVGDAGTPERAAGSCRYLAVESGFQSRGPGLAKFGQRRGDETARRRRDLQAVAAGGSDAGGEEAVLAGQLSMAEMLLGSAVTSTVEAGSAKRPKSG